MGCVHAYEILKRKEAVRFTCDKCLAKRIIWAKQAAIKEAIILLKEKRDSISKKT
ncbi:MAG: hypothetical protein KAV87_38975 [Desulfobacteraceae bacterium]|nr:hypothetical protein [Desulfobacteraceae bacterium]